MSASNWTQLQSLDLQGGPLASANARSPIVIAAAAVGILAVVQRLLTRKEQGGIQELGGFPLLTVWPFFSKRYDFIWENFRRTGHRMFRFKVLQHGVVMLFGDSGRKFFFNDPTLNLSEGYRILMGGAPRLEDIDISTQLGSEVSLFGKKIVRLLRRERINSLLPTLFDDVQRRMDDWGKEGQLNPFKEVYDLVFQMTVRMSTCQELSEDKEAIERLAQIYWDLERSATPVALLFPWLPSPSKRQQREATTQMYNTLKHYVDLRRSASEPTADAIDVLISEGESDTEIIAFVLGVIFAGVINTGMNVCWNLLYIGVNPEWKEKVTAEVHALVAKYTDTLSSEPLHKRLSAIPMEAWEDDLPIMDSVMRETLRLISTGTLLRRNLTKDFEIEGSKISKGEFLGYSLADVHRNPEIYPDPLKFDPQRYTPGREEDKKVYHGYAAWGLGRHPCLGMRVAKLEIKLVLALIFAGYDWEIVDATGKTPTELPQPDKNDLQQARPIGSPCFMRFHRTVV